jgi:hypothetical protein
MFVAPYRVPIACLSLQFDSYLQNVDRTVIVSPVPARRLDMYFDQHGIDIAPLEYVNDRELIEHYPAIEHWSIPGDTRNDWLKQQALKLAALDYFDYDVALIHDPDTWMIDSYQPWDGRQLTLMAIDSLTEESYNDLLPAVLGFDRQSSHCFVTELFAMLKQDWNSLKDYIQIRHQKSFLDAIIDAVPTDARGLKWFSEYELLGNWTVSQRPVELFFQKRFEFRTVDDLANIPPDVNALCDQSPGFDLSMRFVDWHSGEIDNFQKAQCYIKHYLPPQEATDPDILPPRLYATQMNSRFIKTEVILPELIANANQNHPISVVDMLRLKKAIGYLRSNRHGKTLCIGKDRFLCSNPVWLFATELLWGSMDLPVVIQSEIALGEPVSDASDLHKRLGLEGQLRRRPEDVDIFGGTVGWFDYWTEADEAIVVTDAEAVIWIERHRGS